MHIVHVAIQDIIMSFNQVPAAHTHFAKVVLIRIRDGKYNALSYYTCMQHVHVWCTYMYRYMHVFNTNACACYTGSILLIRTGITVHSFSMALSPILWLHHPSHGSITHLMAPSPILWLHHPSYGSITHLMAPSPTLWLHHPSYGSITHLMAPSPILWLHLVHSTCTCTCT